MNNQEARDHIAHLREHAVGLTEWEAGFLESLSQKLEQYGDDPSPKRVAIIDKIRRERLP